MRRSHLAAVMVGMALCAFGIARGVSVTAQQRPEMRDMQLVGYNDLQARSGYQPVIHKQGDRWIAYIGHHGGTQPNPLTAKAREQRHLHHRRDGSEAAEIPHAHPGRDGRGRGRWRPDGAGVRRPRSAARGQEQGVLAALVREHRPRDLGRHRSVEPEPRDRRRQRPRQHAQELVGVRHRHRLCHRRRSQVAHAPHDEDLRFERSGPSGVHPRLRAARSAAGIDGSRADGASRPDLLGPKVNRVYFGYGTGSNGIVQIVDRDKLLNGPKEPTEANLLYPQITRLDLPPDVGAHTAFPLLGMDVTEFSRQKAPPARGVPPPAAGPHDHEASVPANQTQGRRDFIAVTGESTANECLENRQMLRMVDATIETRLFGASSWTLPGQSADFCARGGRFGTHSSNENFTPIYYKRVLFLAHFNAGVRAIDIRDPFNPKEIGYYIPAITSKTDKRCVGTGADQRCQVAIQTNNVEVDDRGYIYAIDRANTGMHILELTGAARKVPRYPGTN